MREWLEEDRESLRIHRHLTETAQSWEKMGRDIGDLYRGARLARVLVWASAHEGELNPLEREFLFASDELMKQEQAERSVLYRTAEDARKKLARDLHDNALGAISAIAMRSNVARLLIERDPEAAVEELYEIEELARRTMRQMRNMLFTLQPLALELQGLAVAMESMAREMTETYNQSVIIQIEQHVVEKLDAITQSMIFYTAEEGVVNACKHAQAAHIWVRLKMLKDDLNLLEIEDNGVGFDMGKISTSYESRGSLGMANMRERVELMKGTLRIDSAKGRGTRIQVVIPLTEEAAESLLGG